MGNDKLQRRTAVTDDANPSASGGGELIAAATQVSIRVEQMKQTAEPS